MGSFTVLRLAWDLLQRAVSSSLIPFLKGLNLPSELELTETISQGVCVSIIFHSNNFQKENCLTYLSEACLPQDSWVSYCVKIS